ncbi:iron chelate uptake ABC transporter family permease subunit [Rhizobium sp. 21-4511-3d]
MLRRPNGTASGAKSRVGRGAKGMLAAALVGASLMVSADWIGRVVDFPYEIPAGVIASLVGTPYFFFAFLSGKKR